MTRSRSARLRVKRGSDVVAASLGLIVFAPLLLAIALLVLITLGQPAFFRQRRPGQEGRPFVMLKFRTMRLDPTGRLPDEQRLTRIGRLLRASSLDELPELWNVLRGDMSLVGPRPLLMSYLDHYTPEQMRRHEMRPGITGWAQVHGRNAITWEERFRLDCWYVDHWSLWLDVRISAQTARDVLKRDGISAPGHATMPRFQGAQDHD